MGSSIGIEKAEFFRALPREELFQLAPRVTTKRFKRNSVLFFEGRPADLLWVVARGEVRLYKSSAEGRITTLELLEPGEIFGAVSALDVNAYPASAEAVTDGFAWCVPRSSVLRLIDAYPQLGVDILRVVSGRLRDAHERLRSFAHDPAPARLAGALLRVVQDGEAHVTRRALAEASATTVETAIRVLRRFERSGLIQGGIGQIQVLDAPGLERIALAGR